MPRIDPVKLLTCISSLLSSNGGIRSTAEVKRLTNLMGKYSKKLVSKCIYIQILKCTDTELLGQFMSFGGWALVHTWLTDGIESKNWALVQELLELLLCCPVDVPRLQSNSAPKLVKSLSREEGNDGVRILAAKLVEQWLKIARGEITSQSTNGVNKENRQSQLIANTVTDVVNDSSSLDNCLSVSEINGNDMADGAINHVIDDRDDESLVFKISVKDGMKTVHKVTDTSPRKNKETDSAKSPSIGDGAEKKHKDEKSSSRSKTNKDRERSKDRDKDRHHKKSSSSSSSHKSSSSSSKHSSSNSSSKSHKSSSSKSSSSRDKDRHRSKSSSSSSKDRKEDKDKSNSDASKIQAEKDKDTLAKIQPQPLAKVKIPKKISDNTEKTQENEIIPPKKKSISIEVRKDSENRPKTAKTYNSQFRNHGLAEEAPPPPSRRDLKKPSSVPTSGLSIPSNPTKRSLSPPSIAKEAEKKIKLTVTSPTVEKAGAIKLIPAKPKPPVLIESDMFMDAMTAATTKKEPRKRKRNPSAKEGENNGEKAYDAQKDAKDSRPVSVTPLRFYKDTLEENENKDDSKTEANAERANAEDTESKEKRSESQNGDDNSMPSTAESPEEPAEEIRKREPGPGCGPDGPPGVLTIHRRKGPKKILRWKPQETLEEIRFFELDENERINVTKTFVDMKQMERTSEREAFLISRKIDSEDTMMEQMEWAPLVLVDDVPDLPVSTNSNEKQIQAEREKNVLQAIYFNRASIPDSPHEPDVIALQNIDPPIIPLEDVTGNPDAVHDFTNMTWPEPKGSPPSQSANHFNELAGLSAFGSFNQFGNSMGNWQNPNGMIGLQPPATMAFGQILAPEAVAMNLNPLQQFNAANLANISPIMQQQLTAANNMGYMNTYAQPVPPMMNDNNRNNRGNNNRFGTNNNSNAANNNWQAQGNNNNRGPNWVKNRRICTAFQRGFCRHGDKCKYLHPGINGPKF